MRNKGKFWAAGIGLPAIIAIVFGVYQYEVKRQQQIDEARTQVEIGIMQFKQKDYEGALQTLRATPEVGIQDWRNPYYQGVSLVQLNNYETTVCQNSKPSIGFAFSVSSCAARCQGYCIVATPTGGGVILRGSSMDRPRGHSGDTAARKHL